MKRFLLFSGDEFYAGGGAFDLEGDFDDLEAAVLAAEDEDADWWHVYDLEEKRIARKSKKDAYT